MESLLGLLLNITSEPSSCMKDLAPALCEKCISVLMLSTCPEPVLHRAVALMSHMLPLCQDAVNPVTQAGGTEVLLEYLKVSVIDFLETLQLL